MIAFAAVAATKDFRGALGLIGFDEFGDNLTKTISIWVVEGSKWAFRDQFSLP